MKINLRNKAKIEAALKAVNGKADAQTISCVEQLEEITERAERELIGRGVSKKERAGCGVEYVPRGPSSGYKYSEVTTRVILTRGGKDWFLVECSRFEGWPGQREVFKLRVTDIALNQIKRLLTEDLVDADGATFTDDAARLTAEIRRVDEKNRKIEKLERRAHGAELRVKELRAILSKERSEREAAQRTVARLGGVECLNIK